MDNAARQKPRLEFDEISVLLREYQFLEHRYAQNLSRQQAQ